MKKMKYLLLKTQKQKSKIRSQEHAHSQYINTMKHQAIKSLQDFQQNCLNQTQLNITLTSDRPSSQYHSRSDHKQNMRKTQHSKIFSLKSSNNNQQTIYDASAMNIRRLLKIKTQVEQKEANKLKNPFYKIQKIRQMPKKFSLTDKRQQKSSKQNSSLCLKSEKKELAKSQQKDNNKSNDDVFISREKKQWYFASKKFRTRTLQQENLGYMSKKAEENQKMMPESLLDKFKGVQVSYGSKRNNQQKYFNEKQQSSFSQFQSIEKLHLRQGPKAGKPRYNTQKRDMQFVNRERYDKNEENYDNCPTNKNYSPLNKNTNLRESEPQMSQFLRQRSLTVKYNEIKDYFEKKYNKSSNNSKDEQNEEIHGYQVLGSTQKSNDFEGRQ